MKKNAIKYFSICFIIEENTDEKKVVNNSTVFYTAIVKDLILNITNSKGREKLMKLSFTVKSTEPTIEAMVEDNKPEIIDTVIAQISARNSEELLTVGGKALLKEELIMLLLYKKILLCIRFG